MDNQFYITTGATPWHVVFGRVINGHKVVRIINSQGHPVHGQPRIKIFVSKCGQY